MAEFPGFDATPAATREWVDATIDSVVGAGRAAQVTQVWENWLLWVMGGVDTAAGGALMLVPELALGWGYGFNVFTLDAPSKGRLYGETTYLGAATILLGALEILSSQYMLDLSWTYIQDTGNWILTTLGSAESLTEADK